MELLGDTLTDRVNSVSSLGTDVGESQKGYEIWAPYYNQVRYGTLEV